MQLGNENRNLNLEELIVRDDENSKYFCQVISCTTTEIMSNLSMSHVISCQSISRNHFMPLN